MYFTLAGQGGILRSERRKKEENEKSCSGPAVISITVNKDQRTWNGGDHHEEIYRST